MATYYWISSVAGAFNLATNYQPNTPSGGPQAGDTIYFGSYGAGSVTSGLSSDLATLTIIVEPGYTGQIGSVSGGVLTYLSLDGGTLKLPANPNTNNSSGSQLIAVNFSKVALNGSAASTVTVETSNSTGAISGLPSVLILGPAITLNMTGGSVGIAARPGEVSTVVAIDATQANGTPYLLIGRGVSSASGSTWTFNNTNVLDMRSNATNTVRTSGSAVYTYVGTGATATLWVDGSSTAIYSGTGTLTQGNISGTFDLSQSAVARTVTNLSIYGGTLKTNNGAPGAITFTNPVQFAGGSTYEVPSGTKLAITAI